MAMARTVRSPASAIIETAAWSMAATTSPPANAAGSRRNCNDASRQLVKPACSRKKIRIAAPITNAQTRRSRDSPLPRLSEDLQVVLAREGDLLEAVIDLVRDRVQAAAADVGDDVDAARYLIVRNDLRLSGDPHVGNFAQAHLSRHAARATDRRVDQKILNGGEVLAYRRDAPDDHLEHLLIFEGLPATVAAIRVAAARRTSPGLRPYLAALATDTSISTVGASCAALLPVVRRHRRCRNDPQHLLRLGPENLVVMAVDAHDEVSATPSPLHPGPACPST